MSDDDLRLAVDQIPVRSLIHMIPKRSSVSLLFLMQTSVPVISALQSTQLTEAFLDILLISIKIRPGGKLVGLEELMHCSKMVFIRMIYDDNEQLWHEK